MFSRALSLPSSRSLSTTTLAGTVPSHQCYIFLHSPRPIASLPARASSAVQRALQLRASRWGGVVNFSWSDRQTALHVDSILEPNEYIATAFTRQGGRLVIPEVSLANLDSVETELRKHIQGHASLEKDLQGIQLYVCTHGARDCRCGETGGAVLRALQEEIRRRPQYDIRVAEVAHVGGHQHAANMLVFPHGEWLGGLVPEGVPAVLDTILESKIPTPEDPPICPQHWRGRMGLNKAEQLELFAPYLV